MIYQFEKKAGVSFLSFKPENWQQLTTPPPPFPKQSTVLEMRKEPWLIINSNWLFWSSATSVIMQDSKIGVSECPNKPPFPCTCLFSWKWSASSSPQRCATAGFPGHWIQGKHCHVFQAQTRIRNSAKLVELMVAIQLWNLYCNRKTCTDFEICIVTDLNVFQESIHSFIG